MITIKLVSQVPQKLLRFQQKKTILLVSVWKMWEEVRRLKGFFRRYAPRRYATLGAGIIPRGEINPLALKE
ncbi:hypothetical protein BH18THE2_BH18THE2_41200 [soil metagenome]